MAQILGPSTDSPLDRLVVAGADRALQLMLWQGRFANPEMAVQITPADIKGLDDCADYLKITPAVRIWRPGGLPAIPPSPAMGKRQATSGREAIPFKDYVVVQMVEAGTENAFKPIENNERDFDRSQSAAGIRALREQIPALVGAVRSAVASGTFSESEILELCEAASKLAKAGAV